MLVIKRSSYKIPKPHQYSISEYRSKKCIFIHDSKKNECHLIKKIKSKEQEKYIFEEVNRLTFTNNLTEFIGRTLPSDEISKKYIIHYINTYDELLNINILPHSTIFSVNIFINGFYLNIYKKVAYRKDDKYIDNLINSFAKFRLKAIDEICKMNEFIYENYEFIYDLIKLKVMFISNVCKVSHRNINELIHINICEIDKLRRIMLLSEQSCPDRLNFINGEKDLMYNFRIRTKPNVLGILSKLSTFAPFDNYLLLNKENFEFIRNFPLPFANIGSTKKTYIYNNTLYVSNNEYLKIINYNKYLNYYYDKSIDGFEKVIPFEEVVKKDDKVIKNFIGTPRLKSNGTLLGKKSAYFKSFTSVNDNIKLISNTLIEDDIIESQQKNINKLLNGINEFNNILVHEECDIFDIIDCILNYKKFKPIQHTGIIFNVSKLNKIKSAVENINFNFNNKEKIMNIFHNMGKFYYDINTRNNLLDYFTEEVFINGNVPEEFKKLAKQVYTDKKYGYAADIRNIYIQEMSIAFMNGSDRNKKFQIYLILMNRKYDKKELDTLEENLRILSLRCL